MIRVIYVDYQGYKLTLSQFCITGHGSDVYAVKFSPKGPLPLTIARSLFK